MSESCGIGSGELVVSTYEPMKMLPGERRNIEIVACGLALGAPPLRRGQRNGTPSSLAASKAAPRRLEPGTVVWNALPRQGLVRSATSPERTADGVNQDIHCGYYASHLKRAWDSHIRCALNANSLRG